LAEDDSGRAGLVDQFSGYGNTIMLHSSGGLVVHRSQDPRIVILEYEVQRQDRGDGHAVRQSVRLDHHDRGQEDRALAGLHGLSRN
jgi:hypothetical protein